MTDATLAEILSGKLEPMERADLHAALDDMLDDADASGGNLDATVFWAYVSSLARGRGIAEDIAQAAALTVGENEPISDDLALGWRRFQWACLSALLRSVSIFPNELIPREFSPAAFISVSANIQAGGRGGEHMDIMGLRTQRGGEDDALWRAARRLLVGAVYYRAAREGVSVEHARNEMIPEVNRRTWQGWVREVAKAKKIFPREVGDGPKAAARNGNYAPEYILSPEQIADLMTVAWRPR